MAIDPRLRSATISASVLPPGSVQVRSPNGARSTRPAPSSWGQGFRRSLAVRPLPSVPSPSRPLSRTLCAFDMSQCVRMPRVRTWPRRWACAGGRGAREAAFGRLVTRHDRRTARAGRGERHTAAATVAMLCMTTCPPDHMTTRPRDPMTAMQVLFFGVQGPLRACVHICAGLDTTRTSHFRRGLGQMHKRCAFLGCV